MSNRLTPEEARKLADAIKANLGQLEENLKYFHAVQGWIPLGYDSFTLWWDNELGELPISKGLRNWAIYKMVEENSENGRVLPGRVAVIAHAVGVKHRTVTDLKSRARPKTRYMGKKDEDPAVVSMIIPTRWHRHIMALSIRKDKPMTELLRPLIKEGMMRNYGVDLDKPLFDE